MDGIAKKCGELTGKASESVAVIVVAIPTMVLEELELFGRERPAVAGRGIALHVARRAHAGYHG